MILLRQMRRNAVRVEGEKSSALDLARGRLVFMSTLFALVYMMLLVRAFDLTILQRHDAGEGLGHIYEASGAADDGRRADIVDRNGVLLATTLKTSSLYADSHLISDPKTASKALVKIFPDLSYGDVLQKLQSGKRFVWIRRGLSPEQSEAVLKIGEPGLNFQTEYKRFYPQESEVAHLVGYTDIDNQGLAGIERGFDNMLAHGENIRLTLDNRLQHVLRREVKKAVNDFEGLGGAGVIMDVTNGEILAGVSWPDFNPHQIGQAKDRQIFNRLTLGAYELGSVFKIFSTAAFFENKDVPVNVSFDAREPIKAGRFTIHDYHAEKRVLTAPEVFMYSSNIGSAMMGQAVGSKALKDFYKDLGLLDPLDFEVREVARPLIPEPWREVNTLTAAFGHGIATTPLQLVAGVSSIVNGGYLVKPHLVLDENAGGKPSQDLRVVKAQTAQRMRQLLRLVVTDGTGSKADVKGYRVGGKTGTAEKIVNGRYDSKKKISSFVGVFPMDAPRYVVFIMVDEPKGQKRTWGYATGGWVAAPAVARVITSMAAILGIPPAAEDAPENHFGEGLKQYISAPKKQGAKH